MTLSVNLLSSLIGIKLLVNQRSSPSSQILHCELELKVKDTWANHRQWDRKITTTVRRSEAVGGLRALQIDTTVVTQAVFSDKYFAYVEV